MCLFIQNMPINFICPSKGSPLKIKNPIFGINIFKFKTYQTFPFIIAAKDKFVNDQKKISENKKYSHFLNQYFLSSNLTFNWEDSVAKKKNKFCISIMKFFPIFFVPVSGKINLYVEQTNLMSFFL